MLPDNSSHEGRMNLAPLVHVVVVAYGDPEHLRACLASLAAPEGRTTVVDNGRSDEVSELAAACGARYLRPGRNLGFAAGVNLALRSLREDSAEPVDVLLLNPDAQLPWQDVLRLQSVLRADARAGAVAPLLQHPSGAAEPASWPLPSPGLVWADALGLSRFWTGSRFLTGAVLMLRAEAIEEVGLLDERYFLYAEEADWQLRARRAGWSLTVVEDVVALHLGGATSTSESVRSSHFQRSGRLFAEKWYGGRGAVLMQAGSAVAKTRRRVTARREPRDGQPRRLLAMLPLPRRRRA